MLLWFAVVAPVIVAEVFRSPMLDYRLVALGALAPLIEVAVGRPSVLHTLLGSVVALFGVMLLTRRRRLLRRRLLGIPIGLFLHLVLDGTWTRARLFWWPAFGTDLNPDELFETGRSPFVLVLMEIAAVAVAAWAWRRYGLNSSDNRTLLARTGHLSQGILQ